ncbi:MAG: FAD-dependent oxidoreductase [bacterium]|nr:FAD-dependent oxidoreductase [bacterium]
MSIEAEYPVIIIGGGIAGLSCAYQLGKHGIPPLILEKRPYLGGRATTQPTVPPMDNSPHLLSSAYRHLLSLLSEVNTSTSFPKETSVEWYDRNEQKKRIVFSNSRIRLVISLLKNFSLSTVLSFRYLFQLVHTLCPPISVEEWFSDKSISDEFRDFIRFFTLSVMNTEPRDADLSLFQVVIKEALLHHKSQFYRIQPLQDCIIEPLAKAITAMGGNIRLRSKVVEIQPAQSHGWEVHTSEHTYRSEHVVLALPSSGRAQFLEEPEVRYSPIVTVRLLYQNLPTMWWGETSGLLDWFFVSDSSPQLVECVKSSAFDVVPRSNEELFENAIQTIKKRYPKGIWLKSLGVVRELYATPYQSYQWHQQRRNYQTDRQGLWVAADDVQTNLPATMESAAKAGKTVGELLCQSIHNKL